MGLIGNQHKSINENNIKNMLKISGLTNHLIMRKEGKISVTYKIDNDIYKNTLHFSPTSDEDIEIIVEKDSEFEVLNGDFIKALIIGFTQNRGILKLNENDLKQRNEVQLPHLTDLIPLINNEGDNRLKAFSTWIINLDAKANKSENEALKNKQEIIHIVEREIIIKVFQILSEITDEEINFKEVLNNNDVWITTQNNPEGISLDLTSQGFQSVIGWIGYFLQRMAESYSDSKDFTKESAICFVDEIDIYIHPKWQRNILEVLERHFENTQFIVTTHSPLVISNLKNDRTNVYRLQKDSIEQIFAYGKDVNSILFEAYGVNQRPDEAQDRLDNIYRLLEDEKIEEAKNELIEIKKLIIGDDPDIIKAETMISVLED